MKVGCLEVLQFHLLFKLAGEASRRWVRPLCVVWGSSDLMVQTETSVSAGSGETPPTPLP